MKKIVVLLIVAGTMALASCSSYTCPTYAKAPKHVPAQDSRI